MTEGIKKYQVNEANNIMLGQLGSREISADAKSISAIADYSSTVANTVKVTIAAHGWSDGDQVVITGTTDYNGTFSITKIDTDNFYVTETYTSSQIGVATFNPRCGYGTYVNDSVWISFKAIGGDVTYSATALLGDDRSSFILQQGDYDVGCWSAVIVTNGTLLAYRG